MAASRTERDLARGRCAAARVRLQGGLACAASYAQIEATFSPAVRHSIFKDRVATLMRRGVAHPEVWIRYRTLFERHPIKSLDAAIMQFGLGRRAELEARAAAIRGWGHCSRPRLSLMMLDEIRLILRVVRRYAPTRFPALMMEMQAADIRAPVWTDITADAAE